MSTIIGTFGAYLNQKTNSSQKVLSRIDFSDNRVKKITFPVSYSKKAFIKPIKKYQPKKIIIIGNWEGNHVKLESKAHNKYITLKSPIKRFLANTYSSILWLFGKNITTNKLPQKKI